MRTQQDDHHIWYYLGIVIFVSNTWILTQQSTAIYGLVAVCIAIGVLGGLKSAFTQTYDRGQQLFRRLPAVHRQLALIAADIFLPVLGSVQTKLSELRDDIEQRDQVDERVDEFVDTADSVGMLVPEITGDDRKAIRTTVIDEENRETTKLKVYPVVADRLYCDEPRSRIETRLVILYTYEMEQAEENSRKSQFKYEIDRLLTSATFHPLNDEGERVLSAFICFRRQDWTESSLGAVFDRDVEIPDPVIEEFVKQYTRQQLANYLMRSKEQAQEFRQTLSDLIRHGRIRLDNLAEDVIQEKLDEVKQELEERNDRYSCYVVMSTKLLNSNDAFGAVQALEEKFPQTVYVSGKSVVGDGFPDLQFVSMRLVYTDQSYDSADDFIDAELKPLLPPRQSDEWPEGGFVAAIPFEAPDAKFYPREDDVLAAEVETKRDSRRDNIEAVKMMTVARDAAASNIVADDVQREEDIDTLLRVIPFNVVAPDLDAKVKEFIKYNYNEVKPHFPKVDSLFHWPEVDKEELADVLRELDCSGDDDRVCEDWDAVVDKIMDEIEKIAEASQITVYSDPFKQVSAA